MGAGAAAASRWIRVQLLQKGLIEMTELTKTIKKAMSGDFDTQFELIYAFAELEYSITIKKFEEEKKMLNVDKYRKEIDDYITTEKHLGGIDCKIATLRRIRNCEDYECEACMKESLRWLFSEYKPPLLENGDGLKAGGWIMVRDCEAQSFVKRQFLYFYGNRFYCARKDLTPLDNQTEWYMQARLPEDGE